MRRALALGCPLLPWLAVANPVGAQSLALDRCSEGVASLAGCASLRVETRALPDARTEVRVLVRSWEGTDVGFGQEHWVGVTDVTFTGAPGSWARWIWPRSG